MNKIFSFALLMILLSACKKDKPLSPVDPPDMQYTDLYNAEVKFNTSKTIDIDCDGKKDFGFGTMLVGDPIGQKDRRLYQAYSTIDAYYLNNEHEETPPLNKGDKISLLYSGFEWNEISSLVLAEKVTLLSGETFWDGIWKNASHKYLPLHIKKNGLVYFGWIELSFDKAAEKIILHKAAISKKAGNEIEAGH
ncbi:MAG: hypothetical protein V4676_05850 [Bacteroidota bacterium]